MSEGALETSLGLPREIAKDFDFVFSFASKRVVVEVEKANREKILYDFLKFHMYLVHGADFALLFLPKNWAHTHGETDLFDCGVQRYSQCVEFGFGTPELFDRILLVGYEQFTAEGKLTSAARKALIVARRGAGS